MNRKKTILALVLVFSLSIGCITAVSLIQHAEGASYKQGSVGKEVRQIQTKLQNWGYYSGAIDGIYGSKTAAAVRSFQSNNGLTVDGICGRNTLSAMGISIKNDYQGGDVDLLARVIAAEARGEPYVGQVAVGAVILNRIEHPAFPNTLSGVVYQRGAFSCLDDGQFYKTPVGESEYKAARDALNGWDPTGGAIYYFNPATATSAWIWSRPLIVTIGKHRFCS